MTDPIAPDKSPGTPPQDAVFDPRLVMQARAMALTTLAVIFGSIVYSRETGFTPYAVLFAIPYVVFMVTRASRKWQAWGWALGCTTLFFSLLPVVFAVKSVLSRPHHSDVALLIFLLLVAFAQIGQMLFVRRASAGKIPFLQPLVRSILYYVCVLFVVAATLPNWFVPATVRSENKALQNLRSYSRALDLYKAESADKAGVYPPSFSALATAPVAKDSIAPAALLDSQLLCAQPSCVVTGYRFTYHPELKDGRVVSYMISARPVEFEETGKFSYLLTADGNIHVTRDDREALLSDGLR